jgi:putative molybdopterin biosynthesis protein
MAIEHAARQAGLGFLPVREEQYDFVVPAARRKRPAVEAFRRLLDEPGAIAALEQLGCHRSHTE